MDVYLPPVLAAIVRDYLAETQAYWRIQARAYVWAIQYCHNILDRGSRNWRAGMLPMLGSPRWRLLPPLPLTSGQYVHVGRPPHALLAAFDNPPSHH